MPCSKASGQYHSVKGTIVETIGDLTGASSWKQSGQEEHAAGEAEHNAAKAKGFAEGTANRVSGKVDNVIGAVTGNEERQAKGKSMILFRNRSNVFDRQGSREGG